MVITGGRRCQNCILSACSQRKHSAVQNGPRPSARRLRASRACVRGTTAVSTPCHAVTTVRLARLCERLRQRSLTAYLEGCLGQQLADCSSSRRSWSTSAVAAARSCAAATVTVVPEMRAIVGRAIIVLWTVRRVRARIVLPAKTRMASSACGPLRFYPPHRLACIHCLSQDSACLLTTSELAPYAQRRVPNTYMLAQERVLQGPRFQTRPTPQGWATPM